MRYFMFIVILFLSREISAQEVIISGQIADKKTGQSLAYANIIYTRMSLGTVSDLNGQFKLRLLNAEVTDSVVISFMGYKTIYTTVEEALNTSLFKMEPSLTTLEDVVIKEKRLNVDKIVKDAIRKYNATRRETPHIALAFYRETSIKDNRHIMFAESIGYSIFSGKMSNAALLSNYKFFCDNTRALIDDPNWAELAQRDGERVLPGSSQNVNLLRIMEERGILSGKNVGKYNFQIDSSFVAGGMLIYVFSFKGNGDEGFMEVREDDLRITRVFGITDKYWSNIFNRRLIADVDLFFTYYNDVPFVTDIKANFNRDGINYQNTFTILLQKFDEFRLSKNVYWAINDYSINPFINYDRSSWDQENVPDFADMEDLKSDLGVGVKQNFISGEWWNPNDSNEYARQVVTSLIDNFR